VQHFQLAVIAKYSSTDGLADIPEEYWLYGAPQWAGLP
jgi:hypothetical protein